MNQSVSDRAPEFIDDVAQAVSHAMRIWTWWILISGLFVIALIWLEVVNLKEVVTDYVLSNSGKVTIFIACACVIVPLVYLLKPVRPETTELPVVRARIASTVVFLTGCIFLTGGILDSPYSAVLGLYIGSFVTLQQITAIVQTKYSKFALWILIITLALCIVPYIYLHVEYGCLTIIHWKEAVIVGWFRILTTISLVAITAFHSVRLGKRLEEIANNHNQNAYVH